MMIVVKTVLFIAALNVPLALWVCWPLIVRTVRRGFCVHHVYASGYLCAFDERGIIHRIDFCSKCGKADKAGLAGGVHGK